MMLVLSRKRGDQIIIGDDIVVTVVQCQGHRIKLGIEAPPHVRVVRSELLVDCADPAVEEHGTVCTYGFTSQAYAEPAGAVLASTG